MTSVYGLALVAVALGLSNVAAAIGIGLSGLDRSTRLRVGAVFGAFEAGMPIIGVAIGRGAAHALEGAADEIGGSLLIAIGLYALWQARGAGQQAREAEVARTPLGRLLGSGLPLSLDNLAVGFARGAAKADIAAAAVVIGAVSAAMSLAGLELGARIGTAIGRRGELLGALVLAGVGITVACGAL